jgi:hypothetical protein
VKTWNESKNMDSFLLPFRAVSPAFHAKKRLLSLYINCVPPCGPCPPYLPIAMGR